MPRQLTPIPPGSRFGRLIVEALVEDGPRHRYSCACDCGNTAPSVPATHLRRGITKSCGCLQEEMHAGRRAKPPGLAVGSAHGRLTITGVHKRDRQGIWHYHVQCECGTTKTVRGDNLKSGNTSSCGCAKLGSRTHPRGSAESAITYIFIAYRRGAQRRGHAWDLTREQLAVLITGDCHYCGTPPATLKQTTLGPFLWNGIDRLQNDQGYAAGNLVPCCRTCNTAKNTMTVEAFAQWVKRIASRVQQWHPP